MRYSLPLIRRAAVTGLIVLGSTATYASTVNADISPSTPETATAISPIVCPVAGHNEFVDSWGDPRPGGRRHQGVDMGADRGTPIVAALGGYAEFKRSRAGGNAVWLTTPDGDKFYYAHLEAWEGSSRDVSEGEVIGYVGSSGNAGGPHLHFEVHPGGSPTNPFPYAQTACAIPATPPPSSAPSTPSTPGTQPRRVR